MKHFERFNIYAKTAGYISTFIMGLIYFFGFSSNEISDFIKFYIIDLLLGLLLLIGIMSIWYKRKDIDYFKNTNKKILNTIYIILSIALIGSILYQGRYYKIGLKVRADKKEQMTEIEKQKKELKENKNELRKNGIELYKIIPLYSYKKLKLLEEIKKLNNSNNQHNETLKLKLKYDRNIADSESKFKKAKNYYEKKKYKEALNIINSLITLYPQQSKYILFKKMLKKNIH